MRPPRVPTGPGPQAVRDADVPQPCFAYFVARPRHILCAAGIAHSQPGAEHALFVVDRLTRGNSRAYLEALSAWKSSPFRVVHWLPSRLSPTETSDGLVATLTRALRKLRRQRANLALIRNELTASPPHRLYVGSDHLPEMQFGMATVRRLRSDTRCIYFEDGTAAYVHYQPRSRRALWLRRRAKLLFRRLLRGTWRQRVDVLGTSKWIDESLVAFPALALDELRRRPVCELPAAWMLRPELRELAADLGRRLGVVEARLRDAEVILLLAMSRPDATGSAHADAMTGLGRTLVANGVRVIVKHHPSERATAFAERADQPQLHVMPSSVSFEFALVLLQNPGVMIVGDLSSALLSARWLMPQARVFALAHDGVAPGYSTLFRRLGIEVTTDPSELVRRAAALVAVSL